jgi:site-specific recombinase XerD
MSMRTKGRTYGRFISLSGLKKLASPPGSPYPLLIVDATGFPVFFLCEWYRHRKDMDPGRTADTYLDMALPWAGFLLSRGYAWNAPPDRVRAYLVEFLREDVACLVAPDPKREESLLVETTGSSPLSKSSLGVLLAALTSVYDELSTAGYYPYPNPLRSEKMIALKREHIGRLKNAGAPDHAGIRGESWQETNRAFPTNQFRQRRGQVWEPQVVLEPDAVQERMRKTIDYMALHATFLRDQVILLLLRQTGARLSEVLEMTIGGYRAAHHTGRALVKNKGSHDREEKLIHFTQSVDAALVKYVRTERAKYDPQGRKRLEELDDCDPLFLTRTGKPYTRIAFYFNWKKLFEPAQQQFHKAEQVFFTPHDLRHLRVTRTVTKIRKDTQGDGAKEAALLEGFQHLMGWSSLETMATYTKTMNKRKALEAVLADEEEQERHVDEFQAAPLQRQGQEPRPGRIPPQWAEHSPASAHGSNDEFSWYEENV